MSYTLNPFCFLHLYGCFAMIVVVLMQKPVTGNIGTIAGEDTQTYAGKNKGKSKEHILRLITIGIAAVMAVLAIFFFITYLEV